MKNIIIITSFLLAYMNAFAAQTTLVPFVSFATYEDATKESDYQIGLYSSIKKNKNTFELLYEHRTIAYKSTTTEDTNQNDLAFLYSYHATKSLKIRGSAHYILSSDKKSDKAMIGLVGIENNNKKIALGINLSVSKYNDLALSNFTHQVTPYIGFYYGDVNSKLGNFYAKFIYDAIFVNGSNQTLEDSYNSYTFRLEQTTTNFQNIVQYWFGNQLYAVRNNALTVYNLDDIHTGGIIVSSKYKFTKNKGIQFSYINEDFKTFGTSTESNLNRFLLSLNFTF